MKRPHLPMRLIDSDVVIPVLLLVISLAAATICQVWLGYRATRQWRTSASMVVERRADEVASLLIISLMRDMRGGYESLAHVQEQQLAPDLLSDFIARTFARFPYIDCFFLWTQNMTDSAFMFSRTDRLSTWAKAEKTELMGDNLFPVNTILSPTAYNLITLAHKYRMAGDQFAFFDTSVDGSPYQVVARVFHTGATDGRVSAVFGFAISVDWVKTKYFSEFARDIDRLAGKEGATSLSVSIIDEVGTVITQTRPGNGKGPSQDKKFPLVFFDFSAIPLSALDHMTVRRWTARVSTSDDPLLGAADAGAERNWILIFLTASISFVALFLVIRFLRMNMELFAMKADFVAMVSHELKTPLSSISLVGQALSKGRCNTEQIADYGALISKESTRLTRLVENLLTFSRVTSSKPVYSMVSIGLSEILNEAVSRLERRMQEKRINVECKGLHQLPHINCDREAITEAFVNLIENAIKYSNERTGITIGAVCRSSEVIISVQDHGSGILPQDVPHVFERFFRGKNAEVKGSGLGLAIAQKIIEDHRGQITIDSTRGQGTLINVTLPITGEVRT